MLPRLRNIGAAVLYGIMVTIIAYDPYYWYLWAAKACAFMSATSVAYIIFRPTRLGIGCVLLCTALAAVFITLAFAPLFLERREPVAPVSDLLHRAGF